MWEIVPVTVTMILYFRCLSLFQYFWKKNKRSYRKILGFMSFTVRSGRDFCFTFRFSSSLIDFNFTANKQNKKTRRKNSRTNERTNGKKEPNWENRFLTFMLIATVWSVIINWTLHRIMIKCVMNKQTSGMNTTRLWRCRCQTRITQWISVYDERTSGDSSRNEYGKQK